MSSNQRSGKSFSEAGKLGWQKSKDVRDRIFRLRVDTYNGDPNKCVACQKPFQYKDRKKKFCDQRCAAIFNNRHRILDKTPRMKTSKCQKCGGEIVVNVHSSKCVCVKCRKRPDFKVKKVCRCGREYFGSTLQAMCSICVPKPMCLHCGKEVKTGKVYCGSKCHHDREYAIFINRWINGDEDGGRGKHREQISSFVRRWAKENSGGVCSICKGDEWCGSPMPLVVDHIDGNSRNTRPENLRMICGNCDMQTQTYKGRNAGHGRYYRRERYAKGQSY